VLAAEQFSFTAREVGDRYSITSSARPSRVNGNVIPSALAVLRLMMNSNVTD
jgi:hypothetical protein